MSNPVPKLITAVARLREELRRVRLERGKIGFVPTMGALHEGHLSLVRAAKAECDCAVASIYVNPSQFGPNEDLSKYPRTLSDDLTLLAGCATDLVFAPANEEVYRPGHETWVEPGAVAEPLEGQFRPGHFRGVATIVLKLLNMVQPEVAYFGQKDYQQSVVIRRMAADLDVPVTIRVCPTVREPDGLAMSSRNRYLSPEARRRATVLWKSLRLAGELVERGEREASLIRAQMREIIELAEDAQIDYIALVDSETLLPIERIVGPTVVALAVRIGGTRLIDNVLLEPKQMQQTFFSIPPWFFGFGLLLGIWAVASVAMLGWLVWRQGLNADTLGYVPILLVAGAIIAWVLPALCDQHGLAVHGYGVMMFLAVVSATALAARRARAAGLHPDMVFSLAFWMILPGVIGARAFYVIEYWPRYWQDYDRNGSLAALIGDVLNVTKGGLVVYGAFIGGVVGTVLFVRKYRLPLLAVCDLIAPSMMVGLAIGRIGCLLNGCCFGGVCEHPWAVTFPAYTPPYVTQAERGQMYGFTLGSGTKEKTLVKAVKPGSPADLAGLKAGDRLESVNGHRLATTTPARCGGSTAEDDEGSPLLPAVGSEQPLRIRVAGRAPLTIKAIVPPERSLPVHPTQLYSTIDALLICVLLLAYAPFRRRDGELFALMMSIYPVTRFLIESLRTDEAPVFGTGLSISQNVSVLLLIAAAALWCYVLRQPKRVDLGRAEKSQP